MGEKEESRVTIFIPPFVDVKNAKSSLGPVEVIEIPLEEFTDPDIVEREEDFPNADEGPVQ